MRQIDDTGLVDAVPACETGGCRTVRVGPLVVAADHPSLDDDIARFAVGLRAERRYFGPRAAANPKPFPSLIERISVRGSGFRFAAIDEGRVIGLARIDEPGEMLIAVAEHRRGQGVGKVLAGAAVERARELGYRRLLMRSSRRSRAARAMGETMGFMVVDQGRGRIDLILDLSPASYSA